MLVNESSHMGGPIGIGSNSDQETDLDSTNLYIKGLWKDCSQVELDDLFKQYGVINQSRVYGDGVGFVRFETRDQAEQAIIQMNGKKPLPRCCEPLLVKFAFRKTRSPKRYIRVGDEVRYKEVEMVMNKNTNNVYLRCLPHGFGDKDLIELCRPYGELTCTRLRESGVAFVRYKHSSDAALAIRELNGRRFTNSPETLLAKLANSDPFQPKIGFRHRKTDDFGSPNYNRDPTPQRISNNVAPHMNMGSPMALMSSIPSMSSIPGQTYSQQSVPNAPLTILVTNPDRSLSPLSARASIFSNDYYAPALISRTTSDPTSGVHVSNTNTNTFLSPATSEVSFRSQPSSVLSNSSGHICVPGSVGQISCGGQLVSSHIAPSYLSNPLTTTTAVLVDGRTGTGAGTNSLYPMEHLISSRPHSENSFQSYQHTRATRTHASSTSSGPILTRTIPQTQTIAPQTTRNEIHSVIAPITANVIKTSNSNAHKSHVAGDSNHSNVPSTPFDTIAGGESNQGHEFYATNDVDQNIARQLYAAVEMHLPQNAPKVTGMLLKLGETECQRLLASPQELQFKINRAALALETSEITNPVHFQTLSISPTNANIPNISNVPSNVPSGTNNNTFTSFVASQQRISPVTSTPAYYTIVGGFPQVQSPVQPYTAQTLNGK